MIRWLTVNELEYVKDEQQTDTILQNKKYKLNGKYHQCAITIWKAAVMKLISLYVRMISSLMHTK